MPDPGPSVFTWPRVAFGCARFGSISGASRREALELLQLAFDRGVTVFDTAASYGQGDSERILGEFLRHKPQVRVITKIGKAVPLKARLARPLKTMIRAVARRSRSASSVIQSSRGDRLGANFNLTYLEKQLDGSHRRLQLDSIPVVLLHSPAAEVMARGEVITFLERAKGAGRVGAIGVSVDDAETAEFSLRDSRISVIQLPLAESDQWAVDLLPRLKAAGKTVIAREIFRDARLHIGTGRAERLFKNLERIAALNSVTTVLLGTTSPSHLTQLLDMHSTIDARR